MNCKQVQKLLPLYVGHDLNSRRAHLIAGHLQSCATCAEVSLEYQNSRDLMHGFTAPVFSDELYADLRASVWRRVESESCQSFFAAMAAWFQPRFVWTATATILAAVLIVTVYVVAERFSVQPGVIAELPAIVRQPHDGTSQDGGSNFSNREKKPRPPRQADVLKRQPRPDRIVAADRSIAANAYSPDLQVTKVEPASPIIGADNLDLRPERPSGTLRMELQTRDPNIRIIWFTQSDSKPVAHPKGT